MAGREVTLELPYLYEEREYQHDAWDALHGEGRHKDKHYNVFVFNWHRRAGKDMTNWNMAIERQAEDPSTTKYFFPTGDMSRDNLWESYTNDGVRFTDFVPKELRVRRHSNDDGLNDSLKRIEFITGGSIRVMSGHKPQRARGGNSKTFVLSEFQIMDPVIYDIIMAIIEANGGILIINMTANGDSAAKGMLEAWKTDPNVYVSILTVDDTGVFTPEQMTRIRRRTVDSFLARGQSEEEANAFVDQEYYCSWESPVSGSYFGSAMRRAEDDGRIMKIPEESSIPVNTYWDLGIDDSMSIWFVQLVGREVRIIDYYENSGEGLKHYSNVLKEKGYAYGKHYAPHDIEVRELTTGVSRKETAKSLGINFETVKRPNAKEDGIDAIRNLLSRCYFDEVKAKRGISALKGYRKTWNEKLMIYSKEPVHDWTSHGTDAFQTLALSNPQSSRGEVRVKRSAEVRRARSHRR